MSAAKNIQLEIDKGSELKDLINFLLSIKRAEHKKFNSQVSDYLDKILKDQVGIYTYKRALSSQVNAIYFTDSLTNAGINSNLGFFPELKQRIKYRILPPINEDNFLSNSVLKLFPKRNDYTILEKISDENWQRLAELIVYDANAKESLHAQLENAVIILTHQFVTIGIDPYIVKKIPDTDDTDSPFFALNVLVNEYIKKTGKVNLEEIFSSLEKCDSVFNYLKENRATLGISLHLTFLLRRAEQHSERIRLLLGIYSSTDKMEKSALLRILIISIVRSELHSTSIRYFISENTGLLANRIANQTSSKGGHYIGFTKKENNKLLLSAMGGGLVVVFLVYIKHLIHALELPLLPEGILFGLNYGIGFVFMHFTHLTLATKQPAMTASYIAESIEQKGLTKSARKDLALILAQIMRSQFITLIGNLIVVLPVSFFSAWALVHLGWVHVFSSKEASAHLLNNHPILSGSLIFAVFTGVFLAIAGLISGYYDNKVVFSNIPKRVMNHPVLKKIMRPKFLEKFAFGVSNNLGAVAGNLSLGMFLGLAGNFGKFIGIPFDIRHVTISSGNFSIAISQGYDFPLGFMTIVFAGIILIGIINIISSFMFSFLIACRSRYLTTEQTWLVLASMVGYILRNPSILIFRKDQIKID